MKLFEVMEKINPNYMNIVMTVLDEEYLGEKALISNYELVWESSETGFFSANIKEVLEIEDSGLVTIGKKAVFCELLGQEKKLVICGGGHISMAIIHMGLMIGCSVTVLEDRPKFADNARRAKATTVICESFEQGLKKLTGDADTFFIIVTRGHRHDMACLESIIKKEHAYIGMIGSKLRVKKVKEAIIENGGNKEVLNQVYTPIGLNIGAETPEEIAIAIMAEIIEVKNKRKRNYGYSKELIKAIRDVDIYGDKKVLAMIVTRKGSAPREVGTKMLIFSDGKTVGTIGGGCVEADVVQEALMLLRSDKRKAKIYHVDMTGKDAEEEGMICGGVIDVLLESV